MSSGKRAGQQLGINHNGKISMLTHLRYFGHCFNPVTFYYFWNKELTLPDIILAEINTPWDERYSRAFKWTSSNLEKTTHKFDKNSMYLHSCLWKLDTSGNLVTQAKSYQYT